MTLLSDLTRLLLPAAARDLDQRGVAGELSNAELVAISRFLDVAAALIEHLVDSEVVAPQLADQPSASDRAERSAAADLVVIESISRQRV